eukprot:EST42259.1 Hypothetical protein SS50377_18559 [Spironucleus salmonicida]
MFLISNLRSYIIDQPLLWVDQLNAAFSVITVCVPKGSQLLHLSNIQFQFIFECEQELVSVNIAQLVEFNKSHCIITDQKQVQHAELMEILQKTYINPINISMFQSSFNKYVAQHKNGLSNIIREQYAENCKYHCQLAIQQAKKDIYYDLQSLAIKSKRIEQLEQYIQKQQ